MIEFILEYKEYIGIGLILLYNIVTFIVLLVTKKRPEDTALTTALLKLPQLINQAEASGLDGEKKYTYVYTAVMCLLESLTKLTQEKVISKYGFIIDSSIEDILSTPSKKKGV